jgi:hypothetical protein
MVLNRDGSFELVGDMQAALRPGVRHFSFRLPPMQDEMWDASEAKDRWSAQLGDREAPKVRERIDIELRSISPVLVEQHGIPGVSGVDAIAIRLRHPPLICRQVGFASLAWMIFGHLQWLLYVQRPFWLGSVAAQVRRLRVRRRAQKHLSSARAAA